jgi:lysophospholipase L1-like esterase
MKPIPGRLIIPVLCLLSLLVQVILSGNPDPERFRQDITTFQEWDSKNATPADPVLFVGSSSIRMWPTHDYFPAFPVINRGFGGSHISDVIYYLQETVLKYAPRLIIFYAGDNDIADGKEPGTVLSDFSTFADTVHQLLPDTPIIYLPIKPSPSRWKFWPEMHTANSLVEKYCKERDYLHYIDTATPMIGENKHPMPSIFISDSLHLNKNGYDLWSGILAPVLSEMYNR